MAATLHVRWPFRADGLSRRKARAEADLRIAHRHDEIDPSLGWRVQELTSARERARLARSLRGIVKDLSPSRLPGASPLNRAALRPHAALISELAERLDDLQRPVAAAGVVAVRRLLMHPDSPLYARETEDTVADALGAVLERLRPR